MTKVSKRLGLTLANHYGLVERLDPLPDVVLLPHSLVRGVLDRPYRAIRMIRDPRDIWVSGYLYHLRSKELWCVNTDMDSTSPIRWPKVDYSFAHWPEEWKRRYLERLAGKSYQRNLLDRSLVDGLDFELDGYTGCTLATMREWKLNGADALDVKLEDMMADFDGTMLRMFDHFGFTAEQSRAALEVARSEDVRRMDDAAIAKRPQISSRRISKWRDVLSDAQIARFEECHGDLIRELGYEPAGAVACCLPTKDAPGSTDARTPFTTDGAGDRSIRSPSAEPSEPHSDATKVLRTTRDAMIRLSADGRGIRPTAAGQGTYSFVVPAGSQRVRLESRFGVAAELGGSDPRGPRRLGVKVHRIDIRSGADEIVIAADDPSLATGWYQAECAGAVLWRWTDGAAELPWVGISGPAMVTVHCTTLAEYPIYDAGPGSDRDADGDGSLASHDGGAV